VCFSEVCITLEKVGLSIHLTEIGEGGVCWDTGRVGTQDSERRMRMRHLVWAYAVCGSSNPQIATLPTFLKAGGAGVVLLDFKSQL